ncbi:MAG: stage II sporulation protein R [Oscillospiraceae bacterium]
MNKKEISLLLGLVLTIAFAIFMDANTTAQRICKNTLRLHIIANSNLQEDQDTKLLVRDEILQLSPFVYLNATCFDDAVEKTTQNLQQIQGEVNKILAREGSGYTAKCTIEPFYFSTGAYPTFTLPQGEYSALTVRLGKAQGKNWWCVMYPELCNEVFSDKEIKKADDFIATDKITLRFKAVEVYEDIKNTLTHKRAKAYVN